MLAMDQVPSDKKRAVEVPAVEGRAKGGKARAARLSPEERSSIAAGAARKRWEGRVDASAPPKALEGFKGDLKLGSVTIPCAVIQGQNGVQRVLTENGISNALLGGR